MNFIKRDAAATLIRTHWLSTFTAEQLLAMYEPRWGRLRNYELESKLVKAFGGEWCISEWCPFNGRFCSLSEHVPPPHPPMSDEQPHPPQTDVPWNEYTGPLYEAAGPVDERVDAGRLTDRRFEYICPGRRIGENTAPYIDSTIEQTADEMDADGWELVAFAVSAEPERGRVLYMTFRRPLGARGPGDSAA